MDKKKYILITGAGGYVGSNLIKYLNEKGYQVKCISRKNESEEYLSYDSFMVDEFDKKFFADIYMCVHLAAVAHKKNVSQEEIDEVGSLYTEKLLKYLSANGIKIIYLSSIAVSMLEKNIVLDTARYAYSKMRVENILKKAFEEKRINSLVIIRSPMIYGVDSPGNYQYLVNLIKKPTLIPFGSLKNKRSYLHINNLISGIDAVLSSSNIGLHLVELSDPWVESFSENIKTIKVVKGGKSLVISLPLIIVKLAFFIIGKNQVYKKITREIIIKNDDFIKKFKWSPVLTRVEDAIRES